MSSSEKAAMTHDTRHELIGKSPALKYVAEIAAKVAPYDIPVLIEGEPGVGKERLARWIHFSSSRKTKEFVIVDCSSFSDVSLEGELFGYVRGSFAGAIHDKKGLFELADGGTVFLDHVSKMKPFLQNKLLRVLEERSFYKIGGVASMAADIRFIAATTEDLKPLVSRKKFREDLYYRLSLMRITIPPLRERREDIALLANHFLGAIAKRNGVSVKTLSKKAETHLETYGWPGNCRELEKEMEKSVVLSGSFPVIQPEHLSPHLSSRHAKALDTDALSTSGSLKAQKRKLVASLERSVIREALQKTAGNKSRAAKMLSISRQELLRKISAHKLK